MKVNGYKIDHDIEVPWSRITGKGKFADLAHKMQPGDSVEFPDRRSAYALRSALHSRHLRVLTRTLESGNMRVWALKE